MGGHIVPLLCLLGLGCHICYGAETVIKDPMDPAMCARYSEQIVWISEEISAVIHGKGDLLVRECQLKFGLATMKEKARLRVHFDFLYIHDCGVELLINESSDSLFSSSFSNREILRSQCNTRTPVTLHAQPKYFVLVKLHKKDKNLEAFNFRLNISLTESLPVVGPPFHVLVITGLVLVVAVGLAASLLFKYIAHVTQSWHERSVENAMDRAICLFNSQEPLQAEPDLVMLQPGQRGDLNQPARRRPREPEIAFVHRDGRVERFRPHGAGATSSSSETLGSQAGGSGEHPHQSVSRPAVARSLISEPGRSRGHHSSASAAARSADTPARHKPSRRDKADLAETSSLGGCELPPSYEEALEMPIADTARSQEDTTPVGAPGGQAAPSTSSGGDPTVGRDGMDSQVKPSRARSSSKNICQQEGEASTSGDVEYMNVRLGGGGGEAGVSDVMEEPSACDSEEPLLSGDRDPAPSSGHTPAPHSSHLEGDKMSH